MTFLPLHALHSRSWRENRFVYPVLSRRSAGLSIGLNLNPDKICNFDCVYCQVDRRSDAQTRFVDLETLVRELEAVGDLVTSGRIWNEEPFDRTPPQLRRLNDFAFSGDGEPTSHRNFVEVVDAVAEVKRRLGLAAVKLVLITNGSLFHRPRVQQALKRLDENQGEIWAKLDAGTPAYYQLIERTPIPFERILENIQAAAIERPLVIQSLFLRYAGEPPSPEEIDAFAGRLNTIVNAGGQIARVQVYTVARTPAENVVTALTSGEVDGITARVRALTGLIVEPYYGK